MKIIRLDFSRRCLGTFALLLFGSSLALAQPAPPRPTAPPPPKNQPPAPPPMPPPVAQNRPPKQPMLGDALPGLSFEQQVEFADGEEEFTHTETPATGLGPIFNDVSCVACHNAGATGGAGRNTVTRFGLTVHGVFDPLEALGGSLLQARAVNPLAQEVIPAVANTVAQRITTPLFGAGLIEAIPDSAIAAGMTHPKPRGIAGKVSVVSDVVSGQNRIGRFGWKAQQATLLAFAADAYRNEMGVTNRFFPTENAPNGNTALLAQFKTTSDPEDQIDPADGKGDIDRAADFMRLLAPPAPGGRSPSASQGEKVFAATDCAACHTPQLMTGRSDIAALNNRPVPLYSDLLLHDMGALGDGIAQGTAGPKEMRTAPLWGLSARPAWLHDGRAKTIEAAIQAHDGEARGARDHYNQLTPAERKQLLDFLATL